MAIANLPTSPKQQNAPCHDQNEEGNNDTEHRFTCRICLQQEPNTDLLERPCCCRGSMEYAHKQCIQKWIAERLLQTGPRMPTCEVCKTTYAPHLYSGALAQVQLMPPLPTAVYGSYTVATITDTGVIFSALYSEAEARHHDGRELRRASQRTIKMFALLSAIVFVLLLWTALFLVLFKH